MLHAQVYACGLGIPPCVWEPISLMDCEGAATFRSASADAKHAHLRKVHTLTHPITTQHWWLPSPEQIRPSEQVLVAKVRVHLRDTKNRV